MEPVVVLDKVSRRFRRLFRSREVLAVDALSLEIRPGEIYGLLGPNGSGKTTTLQMLLGLLDPSSGSIRLFGSPPRDPAARRRVGYLPEEFSGQQHLTGEETLRFYGSFFGIERRELRRRVEHWLRELDLWEHRDRRVREYSKGMKRRIGLAQCLLHEPDLVVLDEPTNGLDPLGIRKVKLLLESLRDRGAAVLISSHILPEIQDVCGRVAILDRGRKLVEGPLEALLVRSGTHRIVVEGAAPSEEQVRGALASLGLRVQEMRPERATLEEVFIRLVTGEVVTRELVTGENTAENTAEKDAGDAQR